MTRRFACLAALLFLILGCGKKDDNPLAPEYKVFQVPDEYSLEAALAEAGPGDRVLLSGAGPATGDFILPPDVSLYRHAASTDVLYEIDGSLSCQGSEEGSLIEGLKISNSQGSGLVLGNCKTEVNNVWITDCEGAGLELSGPSAVYVHNSDFEHCRPGVLIRDVFSSGHHAANTAPRIASNNFLDNLPLERDVDGDEVLDELGPNLVFQNIAAGDTVYVSWNWWGELPGIVDPEETIWDHKDEAANKGLADTAEYIISLQEYSRDWRP